MGRIKYDGLEMGTSDRLHNVREFEVGQKVVLTSMGHDGLRVTPLVVEKITKTTIVFTKETGEQITFRVSRARYMEGEIRTKADYSGYTTRPNLWYPEDPRLATWIAYRRQEETVAALHTEAVIALSKASNRYLQADDVEAAVKAAQAWLDATAEARAESAAVSA